MTLDDVKRRRLLAVVSAFTLWVLLGPATPPSTGPAPTGPSVLAE